MFTIIDRSLSKIKDECAGYLQAAGHTSRDAGRNRSRPVNLPDEGRLYIISTERLLGLIN
jgi:hypothetical protein